MRKPKKLYHVYAIRPGGVREYLAPTWAKSEGQACNNVRYRKWGNAPVDSLGFVLEAKLVEEEPQKVLPVPSARQMSFF